MLVPKDFYLTNYMGWIIRGMCVCGRLKVYCCTSFFKYTMKTSKEGIKNKILPLGFITYIHSRTPSSKDTILTRVFIYYIIYVAWHAVSTYGIFCLLYVPRSVLELGGGMTGLCALGLACSLACSHITVTDGHPDCVANQVSGCKHA